MDQSGEVTEVKAFLARPPQCGEQQKTGRNPRQAGDADPGKRQGQQKPRDDCRAVTWTESREKSHPQQPAGTQSKPQRDYGWEQPGTAQARRREGERAKEATRRRVDQVGDHECTRMGRNMGREVDTNSANSRQFFRRKFASVGEIRVNYFSLPSCRVFAVQSCFSGQRQTQSPSFSSNKLLPVVPPLSFSSQATE